MNGCKDTRRNFLKAVGGASVGMALPGCGPYSPWTSGSGPKRRPNIVFFLVDDMGWQDTSVPFHTQVTPLNERYRTPNMEKLAAEGMKFTQTYACAVCSPTRVSLMTGIHAARHGVTNWTLRKNVSPDQPHATLEAGAWNLNGLSPVAGVERTCHYKTLPMFLRQAGYRTIHVGKAHFGAKGTPGEDPQQLGFDVNIGGHAAGGTGTHYGKRNFSDPAEHIWDVPGLEAYHGQDIYLTEALTIEANKQIDRAVADETPFYLYMSHYAIHAPWEKDDRFAQKYKDAGLSDFHAAYASMVEGMDKSLGDIRANLGRHGIEDDTIVVFMSDNGAPSQAPRNLPLRAHKIAAYEGGSRVPMIVRWPGVTEPGSVCSDYTMIEDIFPTFLEMAQVKDYQQIGGKIDGISFAPMLRQQPAGANNRPLFWHYPHNYDVEPFSAMRQGDWKLIYFHTDQHYELYNLAEDLGESHNLAGAQTDRTKSMARQLGAFLSDASATMPIIKSTAQPVPLPGDPKTLTS